MPQIARKLLHATRPTSKKPLKLRKTPALQGGNRSNARSLKELFAHHKLRRGNNPPALTDQSRPMLFAKFMEIINAFSKAGLSCMRWTKNSNDSLYVNLSHSSLRKIWVTLNYGKSLRTIRYLPRENPGWIC